MVTKEFSGRWAIVLGGSSGLGLASSRKLAAHGMNVIIVHRTPRAELSGLEQHIQESRQGGTEVHQINMDAVTKADEVAGQIESLLRGEKIYCLLHSIAKGNLKPMTVEDPLSADDFLITAEAMAFSLYQWVKILSERSMFGSDARVLAFTSEGSRRPLRNYAAVSAAKAALEAISRSIAVEFAPVGVKANCICAGVTDTPSLRMIPNSNQILDYTRKRNPQGRITTPEDIAGVVYLMCKDEAAWITGTTIIADGGEHLR